MFGRKIVDVQPFVARTAPGRMLLLIVGSLAFVAIGLWLVGAFGPPPQPGRTWAGWLGVVVFGLCAISGIFLLLGPREQVVIDDRGIFYPRRSPDILPWSEIDTISVTAVRRQRFLSVKLRDPHLFPPSTLLGHVGSLNRVLGFGDVAIGTAGTDRSFDELLAAIERHSGR